MTITNEMTKRAQKFEGTVPYMYLDTAGKVTVGTGHMLPSAAAAAKLPFSVVAVGKAATVAQIEAEHALMLQQTPGKPASYYKTFRTLEMSATDMESVLTADLGGSETSLKSIFADYRDFPNPAKEALVDLCFNLGKAGLLRFTNLVDACRKLDWTTAAQESDRNGVPAARNDEIRALFESAAAMLAFEQPRQLSLSAGSLLRTAIRSLSAGIETGIDAWRVVMPEGGSIEVEVTATSARVRLSGLTESSRRKASELSFDEPEMLSSGRVVPTYAVDPAPPPSVAVRATPFEALPLSQSGGALPTDNAGEYRAMYQGCVWKPSYSTFGQGVRPGPKDHDGVDLYAPVGTKVVAVLKGTAYYYKDDGSEFGNRVTLVFKNGADVWFFLYGHLQDFTAAELANDKKSVLSGTVLGRVGCSGNAGYNCDIVVCNVASTHLHLSLVKEATKKAFDIVTATGWTIATP
ncbi:M23 family metallopeptidase [Rhizobacter sp. AJA081-3]|uniref:peptidoglycan DD-metalloendopeptidase family protein n=1 Tax=Rhizobacter sp. AJA081-3 TaxID=2753607 RepID=UPI001ADEC983|nr:peptidoglycan DD-metalloendopeptidase family protein [Rhizobacter sp. AJA081-3]QTN22204.1 M23 family metallopeptidase [Rhizobacter sp. AJA081-3]